MGRVTVRFYFGGYSHATVVVRLLCCCAAAVTVGRADEPKPVRAAGNWVTIKGQVVFPAGKEIPKRAALNVQQDKGHCLMKGPILDESVIVNPKNRGIKNVVVWLRPDDPSPAAKLKMEEIHPDDIKREAADVVDQPCCMFVERVTCARIGDAIVVKNPAPVVHNFFWSSTKSGEHNANVPAKGEWRMPNAWGGTGTGAVQVHDPSLDGGLRPRLRSSFAVTDGQEVRDHERTGREVPSSTGTRRPAAAREGPVRRTDRRDGTDARDEARGVRVK